MKQILINASQREELRLAIVENNKLIELDIDLPSKNIKSNIYKGTISRVEPSLEAAFVNFRTPKDKARNCGQVRRKNSTWLFAIQRNITGYLYSR